jgi:hypothetical protein
MEEKIGETGRRERRRKELLDDLKERKGYWKWEEEPLDLTMWRNCFVRYYGHVVSQSTE